MNKNSGFCYELKREIKPNHLKPYYILKASPGHFWWFAHRHEIGYLEWLELYEKDETKYYQVFRANDRTVFLKILDKIYKSLTL